MKKVDYRDTVVTYLKSETTADAARNLNISIATLNARIKTLREAGVNVPRKERKKDLSSDLFVAQLNSLIKKHIKES